MSVPEVSATQEIELSIDASVFDRPDPYEFPYQLAMRRFHESFLALNELVSSALISDNLRLLQEPQPQLMQEPFLHEAQLALVPILDQLSRSE